MGISERKERERQEMRQRIIDASLAMFIEEGYEKTSIRNIADKIEYSPATIYLYYKDKDELLYDVQGEAFKQLLELFEQKVVSKSPWKRLEQLCETYVRFGIEQQELYTLMFINKAPMNVIDEDEYWANGQSAFDFLVGCVQACMDKGLLRYKDVPTAALSVWAMGHGILSLNLCCRLKIIQNEEVAVEPMVQHVVQEFLRVIRQ